MGKEEVAMAMTTSLTSAQNSVSFGSVLAHVHRYLGRASGCVRLIVCACVRARVKVGEHKSEFESVRVGLHQPIATRWMRGENGGGHI